MLFRYSAFPASVCQNIPLVVKVKEMSLGLWVLPVLDCFETELKLAKKIYPNTHLNRRRTKLVTLFRSSDDHNFIKIILQLFESNCSRWNDIVANACRGGFLFFSQSVLGKNQKRKFVTFLFGAIWIFSKLLLLSFSFYVFCHFVNRPLFNRKL